MKLMVIGSPHAASPTNSQIVIVSYNHERETTIVNCDVDIVTLGIAVNVLQQQYTEYLGKLDPLLAKQIHDTTIKAVQNFGQN